MTFPIPGRPHGNGDGNPRREVHGGKRVVVKDGTNTTEFIYSDYRDWNNPLHPAEAFVRRQDDGTPNGTVVRDITTTLTETGQMYVVMPVPASVKAAITPTLQPPNWVYPFRPQAPPARAQAAAISSRDAEAGQRTARPDG